jgi:hypothetical protein
VRDALLQVTSALWRCAGFEPATAQGQFAVCMLDYVIAVRLAALA